MNIHTDIRYVIDARVGIIYDIIPSQKYYSDARKYYFINYDCSLTHASSVWMKKHWKY